MAGILTLGRAADVGTTLTALTAIQIAIWAIDFLLLLYVFRWTLFYFTHSPERRAMAAGV